MLFLNRSNRNRLRKIYPNLHKSTVRFQDKGQIMADFMTHARHVAHQPSRRSRAFASDINYLTAWPVLYEMSAPAPRRNPCTPRIDKRIRRAGLHLANFASIPK